MIEIFRSSIETRDRKALRRQILDAEVLEPGLRRKERSRCGRMQLIKYESVASDIHQITRRLMQMNLVRVDNHCCQSK